MILPVCGLESMGVANRCPPDNIIRLKQTKMSIDRWKRHTYLVVGVLLGIVDVLGGRTNRSVVATGELVFEAFCRTIDPVPEMRRRM